ncbi:hypothetical protein CKO20_03735 [Rhodocyclus tenuis]|nr:hypothetical protein [Rhodocyclus tenuis]
MTINFPAILKRGAAAARRDALQTRCRRFSSRSFLGFLCLGAALSAMPALAEEIAEPLVSGLSLRGFGTLGMARSSTDQAEYIRDLTQPGGLNRSWSAKVDTVAGVQANYQIRDDLEAVVQAVSRYRYDGSFRPELTWAFLKFDPNPQLSLRFGRVGTEFYMLADSRMVGYSYLPIRPPVDYFGSLPISYVDGGDVVAAAPFASGLLRGKLYGGLMREQTPISYESFDLGGSLVTGGHVDYQQGAWLWRVGYAQLRFKGELPAPVSDLRNGLAASGIPQAQAVADALSVDGKLARFYSAGISYDQGPLQVQLMASRTKYDTAAYQDSRSAYVIAGYRLGDLTPFVGRSYSHSTAKPLSAGPLMAALQPEIDSLSAATGTDQFTSFFGVRWDFRRDMALKAQVDFVRGSADSRYLVRWRQADYDGRMNVFSLALDFIF